jgi:hypothetical protein
MQTRAELVTPAYENVDSNKYHSIASRGLLHVPENRKTSKNTKQKLTD